jgi:transcriptional regulator with XRE-family HTH domain
MKRIKKSLLDIFVINKVKEYRIKHKMTQADLAFKMGVSYGFIGKIESLNYSTKFNLSHINKLAKIFNCSPKDFLPDKPI